MQLEIQNQQKGITHFLLYSPFNPGEQVKELRIMDEFVSEAEPEFKAEGGRSRETDVYICS